MSESFKKNNSSIKEYAVQGAYGVAVFLLVLTVLLTVSSFVLSNLEQPEAVYGWLNYLLISVSSFIVGKFFFKKRSKSLYPWLAFVTFAALIYLTASLIINNGRIELLNFLLKLLALALFSFLGFSNSKRTKKHKNRNKRHIRK